MRVIGFYFFIPTSLWRDGFFLYNGMFFKKTCRKYYDSDLRAIVG